MRLTFDDVERLQRLAKRAARLFVRTTGRSDELDDAESDAILLLLSFDYSEIYTREQVDAYLVKKTVGALVRKFKKATGRNLKNSPTFVDGVEFVAVARPIEDDDRPLPSREAIRKAIDETKSRRDREILQKFANGSKVSELATEYGVTVGRISQILEVFKRRALFFRDYGGGVAIVDTFDERASEKERRKCPLFYQN